MPRYTITEKAGSFVAGRNNTGAGTDLFLTEKEAEYELSIGTLIDAEAEAEAARLLEEAEAAEAKAAREKAKADLKKAADDEAKKAGGKKD